METLDIPRVLSQEDHTLDTGRRSTYSLEIPKSLNSFSGHFPTFSILPGVVQVHWVMHFAKEFMASSSVKHIDRLKFTHPIFPGKPTVLNIEYHDDKSTIEFKYTSQDILCSSGKVVLDR